MANRLNISIVSRLSWRKVSARCICVYLLSTVSCFLFSYRDAGLKAQTESEPLLRGRVVFSDGMFVRGARVEATAKCGGIGLVQVTTTAEDGSFSFPLFHRKVLEPNESEADCKQYEFRASKKEDYWLPSDENVFSGLTPRITSIDFPLKFPLQQVQIVLRTRGGKVRFRIWDIATDRFVGATLTVDREPVEGKTFGSIMFKTSDDGTAATELLPAGRYSAQVNSYPCGTTEYWTAVGPVNSFTVETADNLDETVRIDVRNIKPLSGENGRRRKQCKP
jgi:hypothetical protein